MKRAWSTERKWECSKAEVKFEQLLHEHGYLIEGYREYQSKTDLKISKHDISVEWSIPNVPYLDINAMFESFEHLYQMTVDCLRLKVERLQKEERV